MVTHVDVVNDGVDLGDLLGGIGNHVALLAGHGNGQLLIADGGLDLLEEERELINLLDLLVVGNLLVVLALNVVSVKS
jgi:hypothetical protein